MSERERKRQKDRQTDRQASKQPEGQIDRHSQKQTDRYTEIQRNTVTEKKKLQSSFNIFGSVSCSISDQHGHCIIYKLLRLSRNRNTAQ